MKHNSKVQNIEKHLGMLSIVFFQNCKSTNIIGNVRLNVCIFLLIWKREFYFCREFRGTRILLLKYRRVYCNLAWFMNLFFLLSNNWISVYPYVQSYYFHIVLITISLYAVSITELTKNDKIDGNIDDVCCLLKN